MFSKQILELEKRVRELSQQSSEHTDKFSNDAEVQTIKEVGKAVPWEEDEDHEEDETMANEY